MQYILHKLLIHINILLAFTVLFCSHSAYGQSVPSVSIEWPTTPGVDYNIIDLGLDVYWADRNVGAKDPQDAGDYFAWGETSPESGNYDWYHYKFYGGYDKCVVKRYDRVTRYTTKSYLSDTCKADNYTTLFNGHNNPSNISEVDDAASARWGGYWRTPTQSELKNMGNNCNRLLKSNFPHSKFVSKINGNNIIITCSGYKNNSGIIIEKSSQANIVIGYVTTTVHGYIWSSSLNTSSLALLSSHNAYVFRYETVNTGLSYEGNSDLTDMERYYGCPVRPVIDKIKNVTLEVYKNGSLISSQTIAACPKGTSIVTSNDDCFTHEVYNGTTHISEEIITESNATYKVYFTQKAFAVNANGSTGGSASVTTPSNADGGKYLCGTEVELKATPDDCYHFVKWSDGNTDSSRSLTVTQDITTLTAVFTIKTTNLEATTEDNRKGSVGLKVGDEIE